MHSDVHSDVFEKLSYELESRLNRSTGEFDLISNLTLDLFQQDDQPVSMQQIKCTASEHLQRKLTAADNRLVEEAVEFAVARLARQTVARLGSAAFWDLVQLYQRQPRLGSRSTTRVLRQQYSTPVPIGYLASELAGIDSRSTVLEPTAGHGALLLSAYPPLASVNEIDHLRAYSLARQGFSVSQQDIVQGIPGDKLYDAVILNPPFGRVRPSGSGSTQYWSMRFPGQQRALKTSLIEYWAMFSALQFMKPDGKAVIIIGSPLADPDDQRRSEKYHSGFFRNFFYGLYETYNVVRHITIDGGLYSRQGAGFPIDLICIHGTGRSARTLPAAELPVIYRSFVELGRLLENPLLPDRLHVPDSTVVLNPPKGTLAKALREFDRSRLEPAVNAAKPFEQLLVKAALSSVIWEGDDFELYVPNPPHNPILLSRIGSLLTLTQNQEEADRERMDCSVSLRRSDSNRLHLVEAAFRDPSDDTTVTLDDLESASTFAQSIHQSLVAQDFAKAAALAWKAKQRPAETVTERRLPYLPRSKGVPIGTLIPVNLSAPTDRALRRVETLTGETVDTYVRKRCGWTSNRQMWQHLAAEQVDAVALCIYNLELGKSAIVGDDTGVGKGRTLAALIRYGRRKKLKTVFLTKGVELYVDILRDAADLGMSGLLPFATNRTLKLPLRDGRELHQTESDQKSGEKGLLAQSGLKPYDFILSTYPQLQTVNKKEPERRNLLRHVAKDALLLCDECHCAGGGMTGSAGSRPKNRAEFLRELRDGARATIFASATFAKEPHVLSLYSTTDMALAVRSPDPNRILNLVYRGGIPLQQAISCQLAEAGQYIRRERSFEGVEFATDIVPVDKDAAETLATCLAAIYEFDKLKQLDVEAMDEEVKAAARRLSPDNSTGGAGVDGIHFTSIMHNLIYQALMSMKVDAVIELVKQAHANNEKPIVGFWNTFGSFLGRYVDEQGIAPGDRIDATLCDMLHRYLERCRMVLVRLPNSPKSEMQTLGSQELSFEAMHAYERATELIDAAAFSSLAHFSASPIDYLEYQLKKLGLRVGEVTARCHTVQYREINGQLIGTYHRRPAAATKKSAVVDTVADFNDGRTDVLLANPTAATGLSIHASPSFADRRVRHLIMLQLLTNIVEFQQLLGRFNRTGQVVPPKYTFALADIPCERRYAAILRKRMAMLNASVQASRVGNVNLDLAYSEDMFNEYGDQIVDRMLSEDPELDERLGYPSDADSMEFGSLIERVTGRSVLLPLAEQEEFYRQLELRYQQFRQQQEAMGNSVLEARTLDLRATVLSSEDLLCAMPGVDSPFGGAVTIERLHANIDARIYSQLEMHHEILKQIGQNPDVEMDWKNTLRQSRQWIEAKTRQLGERAASEAALKLEQMPQLPEDASEAARAKQQLDARKIEVSTQQNIMAVAAAIKHRPPGLPVVITDCRGGKINGVIAALHHNANMTRVSGWDIEIYVADIARTLTFSLTALVENPEMPHQVRLQSAYSLDCAEQVLDSFDRMQGKQRLTVGMLTGNLLRAYDVFGQTAQVLNFTTAEGLMRQGLMLPLTYSVDDFIKFFRDKNAIVEVSTIEQAANLLNRSRVMFTPDRLLRVGIKGRQLVLECSKQTSVGGKYFLNKALIDHAGCEFYSAGSLMRMSLEEERAKHLLPHLFELFSFYCDPEIAETE